MRELKSISRWISENYRSADKIVEIGVGRATQVLKDLREKLPNCELVATDVREGPVPEGVKFVLDDVTDPEREVYRGADLVFSLRAPVELYPYLRNIARWVEADLLIKPVSSEETPPWARLVNYSGASFYILRS